MIGVVLFPGTNCEQDVVEAVRHLGGAAEVVWHGDPPAAVGGRRRRAARRLRPRRLPAHRRHRPLLAGDGRGHGVRPAGRARARHLQRLPDPLRGRALLPGALQKNRGLKFICQFVDVRVETATTPAICAPSSRDRCCGFRSITSRAASRAARRHWPSCVRKTVSCSATSTIPMVPIDDIAGVCSPARNVVGLMPHPGAGAATSCSARSTAVGCWPACSPSWPLPADARLLEHGGRHPDRSPRGVADALAAL